MWVLGTGPGSSTRAANAVNHGAISPAPLKKIMKYLGVLKTVHQSLHYFCFNLHIRLRQGGGTGWLEGHHVNLHSPAYISNPAVTNHTQISFHFVCRQITSKVNSLGEVAGERRTHIDNSERCGGIAVPKGWTNYTICGDISKPFQEVNVLLSVYDVLHLLNGSTGGPNL